MGKIRKRDREDGEKVTGMQTRRTERSSKIEGACYRRGYKEVETPEGERRTYRIAKARHKSPKNVTQIIQIMYEQGVVL